MSGALASNIVKPAPVAETGVEPASGPDRLARFLGWLGRRNVVPLALTLLVAAGLGDYFTGIDVTFTLLYLLPIALGTWFRGRRFGFALSCGAALTAAVAAVGSKTYHPLDGVVLAWNETGEVVIFLSIVWLLDRLRGLIDRERRAHGLAVSQLRHAERLNTIGTLAAGVAHELGTPLNVISGHAQIIGSGNPTREDVRRSSQVIVEQVKRMAETISHLLEFGRRGGSERQLVDLAALAARAASLMAPIATRANCTIAFSGPHEVKTFVNPSEIEQVLANLILNAVQAMPRGGEVRLVCDVEDGVSERGTRTPCACLTVVDEGGGIQPADIPRIFEPFFTTKGVGKGTGLGLSVSYGIVEDHGGSIHVHSELGRGSRFVVRFPLAL